ncbi:MAG: UDP-glucose/GDP-mannose dehydrogenase family protein [Bacteroidetes bacterium]|uniref:UDP-glucose 6-dehydrogenase n=1 Tax=Candidatus Egerieousia excrementavium TaxID=2840778 RepID=A0A9D9GYX6_9BACT|nr:UDP-glucose/GDP-mannose dehydrogenase family protein [Candidatus Egerieousia excrementavium]
MNIAIVGTGYVGLVSGSCFSEMGINVTCIDIDSKKIERLCNGVIPIYEPGLEEMVRKNRANGRLSFSTSLASCIDSCDAVFIAVGTPPGEDGSADLQYVLDVARTFGKLIRKYTLLVTKSTVPIGTANRVKEAVREELEKRGENISFDVASNPEFLKEGSAIKDFMSPDRIVIGVDSLRAKELMERIYRPFQLNNYRVIMMDILSAEMTKYAANAMLATRISFMNEMARLCEATGANIDKVRAGIASDSRIGSKFLYPGCGYGGSCFPKDVKALVKTGEEHGVKMEVIASVEHVNQLQKRVVFEKLLQAFDGDLKGRRIAVWGLSFKPETDDMREAPSVVIIRLLLEAGAEVIAYDPVAMDESKKRYLGDSIKYAVSQYEAVEGADALALVTEWKLFRVIDWNRLKNAMKGRIVVDGRNIYSADEMRDNGFRYYSIGKKAY